MTKQTPASSPKTSPVVVLPMPTETSNVFASRLGGIDALIGVTAVAKKSTTRGPMDTTHEKYALYLRSLPTQLREHVEKNHLDPRAIYKDYRILGKDKLIAKYLPKAA